jgi:hypothetical protein
MSIYIFGLPIGILIILWGLYGGVQAVKKTAKTEMGNGFIGVVSSLFLASSGMIIIYAILIS